MVIDRAPLGLLIAALGAAVLALSVFTPWYGVSITPSGAVAAQQEISIVAQEYGNVHLQARANGIGAELKSLAGRQLATVTAHQTMKHVSLILLVLAGIALLASLLRLADARGALTATGGQIALCGAIAAGIVLFRMVKRPDPAASFVSLSPTWGIWLALASAGAVVVGGLVAGTGRSRMRTSPKVGPGAPVARDVASPLAVFRDRP
jgi:hypothetical protein